MDRGNTRLIMFVGLGVLALLLGALTAWMVTRNTAPESAPGQAPPSASTDGPQDGGTLMVGLPMDPANVNPIVAPYAIGGWVVDLVNPGLVRRKVGEDGLSYEPALAESWEWSDDGMALTYTLRGDLSWEDGAPVTSADVVFTYDLIADPDVASNWQSDAAGIDRVEQDGARKVTFHFKEPRNPVLQQGMTIRGIVPKHVLGGAERSGLRAHPYGRNPVSSGPFRVASWKTDERIILEPNPKAPKDWRPHLDRIVLRIIPEPSTRRMAHLKGEIDMDPAVEPANVADYRDAEHMRIVPLKAAGMLYIGFNQKVPTWRDPKLRTALTYATDVQTLIDKVYTRDGKVMAQPCVSTIAPTLSGWHADEIEPLPYDLDKAKALLDEAGWEDKGGIRVKDGKKLRFTIMYPKGGAAERDLLVLLQSQWSKLGAEVDLESVDGGMFASRAREKRYDTMLWAFGNNPKVDPTIIWGTGEPYNWFAYSNPRVDELLATARTSQDMDQAKAAIRELQEVIYADQPVTFLVWVDDNMVIHDRFKDVQHDTFNKLLHAERWWVPASERVY